MKLIDILVQDLPKIGGWPNGKTVASHGPGNHVIFHELGEAPFYMAGLTFTGSDIVTREEYESALEAALAASTPIPGSLLQYGAVDDEWDGSGMPPVGCECEALMPCSTGELWEWRKVKVVVSGIKGAENECLVYDIENSKPAWVDEFRPIRSEADKKRDEAIRAMHEFTTIKNSEIIRSVKCIYDAIAAGKIPGVRIE